MEDRAMTNQHGRIFSQHISNNLSEDAIHLNQSTQSLCHRNRSPLGYQFHNSPSDCTSSCNSSIFSRNDDRSSYLSSMSSLQSSLDNSNSRERLQSGRDTWTHAKDATRGNFFCPICIQFKDGQPVYMKRKAEMKSHIEKHFSDVLFHCDHCSTARDRFEDLKTHCKKAHGRSLRSTALVGKTELLLSQELFACGFLDWTGLSYCREVRTNSKHWLDHIAEHMERGSKPEQWSYSAVIRNLLRQPELCQLWKEHLYMVGGRDKRDWIRLGWDVDQSRTLMLKLNRRDFRPAINHLLAWAYDLGQPASQPVGQPADFNPTTPYKIPPLKSPLRNGMHGLSMIEIDILLKRGSSISQNLRPLPESHDSATMAPNEVALDFITGHLLDISPMPLQPQSDTEAWLNLQSASNLQDSSGHSTSTFALPQTTSVQYQLQPFHQDPNLPLDAGQPPRPMGPDSHLLEGDTHNPTDFDYTMFDIHTGYHGAAP